MLCLRGSNFGFAVFGEQIIEGIGLLAGREEQEGGEE
jgi:hypothetical protein